MTMYKVGNSHKLYSVIISICLTQGVNWETFFKQFVDQFFLIIKQAYIICHTEAETKTKMKEKQTWHRFCVKISGSGDMCAHKAQLNLKFTSSIGNGVVRER